MRKKRKPTHLDSESPDSELESEVELYSDTRKKKIVKKSLNNSNARNKTSDQSKTLMKSPPPVPLVYPERFVSSPDKIVRQHIPQVSKQPSFPVSVAKDSGKNLANFVQEITSKKNLADEENKSQILDMLKQRKENKQKFKETKKYNSKKESSSSIFITTSLKQQQTDDVQELSNSVLHVPSKNLVRDNRKPISKDTQIVLPSVSGEVCTSTNVRTFRPVYNHTSQSASENLCSEHEEPSHVPSKEISDNQTISVEKQFVSSEKAYLQVKSKLHSFVFVIIYKISTIYRIMSQFSDFSFLEDMINKGFTEVKKEMSKLHSKMDICLMNQEKLNRFLLPGEKVIKKPSNFPSLPVDNTVQLNSLENFLKDDGNLSAAVSVFSYYLYCMFIIYYLYCTFVGFICFLSFVFCFPLVYIFC